MQELLEEMRGAPHLLPVLPVLLRGQGQGEDENPQQGILVSVSYVWELALFTSKSAGTTFHRDVHKLRPKRFTYQFVHPMQST